MSLSKSERQSIIDNEERGIQHLLHYVVKTNGNVQVRKRKVPLNTNKHYKEDSEITLDDNMSSDSDNDYEQLSNKALMAKMLKVLEKSTTSEDMNKNPVERERETNENKQSIENIQETVTNNRPFPMPVRNRRARIIRL